MLIQFCSSPVPNSCFPKSNFSPESKLRFITQPSASSSARKISFVLPEPNLGITGFAKSVFVISLTEEQKKSQVASIGAGTSGGDGDDREGFGADPNGGEIEAMDKYYQKIIEDNPANSLLLGNYAKFLKEVRKDYVKAEEYLGRSLIVNPSDGIVLSLYADLIWETQKDATRAEVYYFRAEKAAPHDAYILAAYARFLWEINE